ncbi:MAG: GW dipeptide domain-containing protein [Actinomycetota bacterium]|nr:GW dipeptide domain-containing protein [Actinomycetota bacterium]
MRPARALVVLAVAIVGAGCGGRAPESRPERPIVLVSGRDDHGLLAEPRVGLSQNPEGPPRVWVRDGTLVAVVGSRGEWLRVRATEGRAAGWVNDYYLRGTVHLVAPDPDCPVPAWERPAWRQSGAFPASAQVELLEVRRTGGQTWVLVRSLEDRRVGWVQRPAVSELPAPATSAHASSACSDP